jgi:hypothetical protein
LDEPAGPWRVSSYRKISFFRRGDDFSLDGMNAFFRASESPKPAERL